MIHFILLLAMSLVHADSIGFSARVTRAEDCSAGFQHCRLQTWGLGLPCQVSVELLDHKGSLRSKTDWRGASRIQIAGAPTILSGEIRLNGEVFYVPTGLRSDNFVLGGEFSAYLGSVPSTTPTARVFFERRRGIPRAYAAYIYINQHAFLCGKLKGH